MKVTGATVPCLRNVPWHIESGKRRRDRISVSSFETIGREFYHPTAVSVPLSLFEYVVGRIKVTGATVPCLRNVLWHIESGMTSLYLHTYYGPLRTETTTTGTTTKLHVPVPK
ncbi:hypothetical protein CDAR_290971 [Caerostris darwini]|uniref:Uncharacterized protein n=1 Tax=Caerostris darwini TaxID=1538125 RepID=A0AAV4VP56_9ARAC|nr:hypothetical protein CDAR_290971 [Caerostris darwini]